MSNRGSHGSAMNHTGFERRVCRSGSSCARGLCTLLLGLYIAACRPSAPREVAMASIAPTTMARVGTVDERYQSYNVEMLEVTGGKFWKPYGPELDAILKQ